MPQHKYGCYLDKRHAQGGATRTGPKKMRVNTFFYKHEGKFTPSPIMLSFLRISGSNYAYMVNISFLTKFGKKKIRIKKPIFCLSVGE